MTREDREVRFGVGVGWESLPDIVQGCREVGNKVDQTRRYEAAGNRKDGEREKSNEKET